MNGGAFPQTEFDELIAWLEGTAPAGVTTGKLIQDGLHVLEWGVGEVVSVGAPAGAAAQTGGQAPQAQAALSAGHYTVPTSPQQAAQTLRQFAQQHQQHQQGQGQPQGAQAGLFGGGNFLKLIAPILIQILTGLLGNVGPAVAGS